LHFTKIQNIAKIANYKAKDDFKGRKNDFKGKKEGEIESGSEAAVDTTYYRLAFIASTSYYGDISSFEASYSDSTVLSVSRMKRLPGYFTAKPNLALYPGTLATVLFTLPNGLAGTDFWSTPLYSPKHAVQQLKSWSSQGQVTG